MLVANLPVQLTASTYSDPGSRQDITEGRQETAFSK